VAYLIISKHPCPIGVTSGKCLHDLTHLEEGGAFQQMEKGNLKKGLTDPLLIEEKRKTRGLFRKVSAGGELFAGLGVIVLTTGCPDVL